MLGELDQNIKKEEKDKIMEETVLYVKKEIETNESVHIQEKIIDSKEDNSGIQETVSYVKKEIETNENMHIQEKIIVSKEDNSEILQQVYIKEEELSCDEDTDSDIGCGTESSHVKGNFMFVECNPGESIPPADYIKEEHDIDKIGTEETSSNRANVEETFGNHFLSNFEDPDVVQNQLGSETTGLIPSTGGIENQLLDKGALHEASQETSFIKLGHGLIKCTQCKYTTSLLRKFNIHKKYLCGRADLLHQCAYCSYKSKHNNVLRRHMNRKHNFGNEVIECPYCKFLSLSFLEVQDHIQEKHKKPRKYHCCELCDYKSHCKGNLEYHIAAKHTLQTNFECSYCDYKFINVHFWRRHMLKVHNKKVPLNKRKKRTCFYKKK